MRTHDDVLVVMAKYPVPGTVKTRLAQHVGLERACRLYRAFLVDIAERFSGADWELVWAVDPPGADLSAIVGAGAVRIDQRGDDLAERMLRCFQELLARPARRVVMIGADAPHLPPSRVAQAFGVLDDHDVSVVPTHDGGYCLIGLRAAHDLFTDIPMGSAEVFADTCARAKRLGLTVQALDPYFDIDEPEDVEALERLIRCGAVRLPATAAVLARWR